MITHGHATLMARYNEWMNTRLYAVCAALPVDALHEDRGAFFGSIFLTLQHMAVSDRSFLRWFTDMPNAPSAPSGAGTACFVSFEALRHARGQLDGQLLIWASTLEPQDLSRPITYTSGLDGKTRTVPKWALVTHMFNHQTHHRGQVTTLLSQQGVDIGSTDVPFLPGFESTAAALAAR